jgi:F0F1-type ATP synthase assembly protein I
MIGLGRASAYVALFSEIGLVLLVTNLGGVLVGYWIDGQLGTRPAFVILGFLAGLALGWMAVYRLVTRFLARLD